ncbi:MAG: GDP-mannose 4,6-dehydratase [Chitinophagales bacterium]
MKKILLTGGAGFIGSNLCQRLLNEGHYVTVIDNFSDFYDPQIKKHNISTFEDHPKFRLLRLDIRDEESLTQQTDDHYDAIIHAAAKTGVRPSITDPLGYESVNVIGTIHLLELARQKNIKQFIFASSSSVYGTNPNVPWKEDIQTDSIISPYAASKRAAELQGKVYSHLHGIRFISLRLFTVFGPKQRPDLAIHKFANAILNQHPITVYGDGNTYRDYTYVDDVINGFCAALDYSGSMFEIINIGNNRPIMLNELVEKIETVFQKKAIVQHIQEQAGDVPATSSNIEKAHKLLGYKPKTSLDKGLMHFRDWLINKTL